MKLISKKGKRDASQKSTNVEANETPATEPSKAQNAQQPPAFEIAYPETQWSQEQMRALKMAAESKSGDLNVSEEATNHSFEHLAPPKKSILKIALLILLILIVTSAIAFGGWYYWWTNYATFDYDLQPVVILHGQRVFSSLFLTDEAKGSGISAKFQNSGFTPVQGRVTVPLTLELGWRSLDTTATLYALIPVTEIVHEYREEAADIDPVSLVANAEIARGIEYEIIFTEKPPALAAYEVGEYTLHLTLNGAPFEVTRIIEDTTAPTATPVSVVTNIGEQVYPEQFVTDINDASNISYVEFYSEPDIFTAKEQLVEVIITDIHGNYASITSSLTVIANDSPPVFEGVALIESMAGRAVAYGYGVIVYDSFGRELEFEVEDSGVNIDEKGEYTAFYIAHDLSGNVTTVEFTVLIIGADPEAVIKQADDIIGQILEDSMTNTEKIRAIHTYIRGLLTFAESDDKPVSLFDPAFQALDTKRGNSFVYSALAEVLLTRAEIPSMRIYRSSEHPSHVWNLVSPDYGESWYHFDAAPTPISYREITNAMYMFTQAQAKDFAVRVVGRGGNGTMYFAFDPELYPEIVAE